jgi:MoaA/NifB/PqqE/SkfB family radical SAM enzyme
MRSNDPREGSTVNTGSQPLTPPAPNGVPLGRVARSRWVIRGFYALDRLSKCLKVVEVRVWRKLLVQCYYRHHDYAPPPSRITIRLTNRCNLRCVQCGQWGERGAFLRPGQPAFPPEMTTEEWKSFIARIAPYCPHVYVFGGEPFLRKDLLEIVRFANSKGVIIGTNTNGTFLHGKGEDIVRSGMDYLIVSLDGPAEVNNRVRLSKQDGFAAVAQGVEELVRARKTCRSRYPLIEMFMTLTEENQGHIVETAELARRWGADYFALTLGIFTTPELARQTNEQFREEFGVEPKFYNGFVRDVSRMDLTAVAAQIRAVERMWGSRYKKYPPGKFDLVEYFTKPEKVLKPKQCIDPWGTMQVMANGDMAYCSDFAELVTGNVRRQDPLALWNNEASQAWRRRIRTKGIFPAETRCCDLFLY